ncbi:MAG: hypothetical protein CMB99_12000 [Flavobacteriaceae bacterium]|nr:hypothetical protein [Flavobacteriaceae bacterium]
MGKKFLVLCLLVGCSFSCAQQKVSFYSLKYKIFPKINIPSNSDVYMQKAALEFQKNFEILTKTKLTIEERTRFDKTENVLVLRVNPTQSSDFCIKKNKLNTTIVASSVENLHFGINEFFIKYTSLNFKQKSKQVGNPQLTYDIDLNSEINECYKADFSYREPYYSRNFNSDYSRWHKTNYLDLNWGIWGHNIPKILKKYQLPESAYAEVNGRRNKQQFCFSSNDLFKYLSTEIIKIYESDNALDRFMILPNDNFLSCTCDKCKKLGNTPTNASPAVFTFLNKLARKYKKLHFFTSAYNTVTEVPDFKAEKNIGLFYSTIKIQKGIPIEKSRYYNRFKKDITNWKDHVDDVYIWDYTVNFDNYFDLYPSLKVTQDNLKLYKKLGVHGVFLHGSEYNYSTLEDLKTYVFARMLWDTDIDLKEEITSFLNDNYSKKVAKLLSEFYIYLTDSFYNSKKELSIYSGIHQTAAKYLDPELLFTFYEDFDKYVQSNQYNQNYLQIATALTFLKLEIMRDYGFGKYGYARLFNNEIRVKSEIGTLLDKLDSYSRLAKISTYNEIQSSLRKYIIGWRETIFRYHRRNSYFFKKKFEVLSSLDEDYTNTSYLNDGAFGLLDYNTNWLLCSVDELVLKVKKEDVKNSKEITFSFLQDTKHRIYFPEVIRIKDTENNTIKRFRLPVEKDKWLKKEFVLRLPTEYEDEQLSDEFIISIEKKRGIGKNTLAVDEIIFN